MIRGDAFDLDTTLGARAGDTFAAAVSSLPLVNFPAETRDAFLAGVFKRLAPGAPFVQFSYRFKPPVAPPPGVTLTITHRRGSGSTCSPGARCRFTGAR